MTLLPAPSDDGPTASVLLVPLDDEPAMASVLTRGPTDADLRARLSAGARRHVVEDFELGARVGSTADRYEDLARRRMK
ncbi:MAG TPA: hypothetical protein VD926_14455 [Acidimicrobiales bacterium]|nr:hypothetical protein [Acidimicrobiales bacterium]